MQHDPEPFTQGVPTPGPERALPPSNGNHPTQRKKPHVANIKSQLKRIKTNAARTERNKAYKSELRTWIRKFRVAAESGDKDAAAEALKNASKKLDKAVSKGVIHANQAANKKSSMARKAASL
ncbi:small subunit ribosomal protein S20 [Terracoccus luteus]|uniref:Small ribosomal subunit protein bS20 n=1 Tax=Terracoccus luteus TaxID=53356 RepID=A0A495XVW0_9MICO|nr:small subunit ribosomal protein S20 [Terracoccus luteus]